MICSGPTSSWFSLSASSLLERGESSPLEEAASPPPLVEALQVVDQCCRYRGQAGDHDWRWTGAGLRWRVSGGARKPLLQLAAQGALLLLLLAVSQASRVLACGAQPRSSVIDADQTPRIRLFQLWQPQ